VPPNYDSLLGKIIAHGKDRAEAIARLERALADTVIEGVPHTVGFHRQILADESFRRGEVHTGFLADFFARQPAVLADAGDTGRFDDRKDPQRS
jgi:acetyl/propionyl-CoA carboxylase alpha subunit